MNPAATIARRSRALLGLGLVCLCLSSGCISTGPRFPDEVHSAYRADDMHRMETEHLKIYYPRHRREEALHVAARLEGCLEELEDLVPRTTDWGLVPVFLPDTEFNNAYVAFGPGNDPHIVIPTSFTANLFGQFGYTPSTSAVGCHEMVHYVHLTQVHSPFDGVNRFFGPSINPQLGLDLWFFEGLATYYESRLVEGVGRYGSPIWENFFAAGIADNRLDPGRMSEWDRSVSFGGHYLVGSYFVAYLVDEYGEEKLWQLIHRQGTSVLFPFFVSQRFESVYGRGINELFEEFEADVRTRFEERRRPEGQAEMRWAGRSAIVETGAGGMVALYSQDVDAVAAIEIFDNQGRRILRRGIPDVLPGRTLRAPRHIEAMRFDDEGRYLYFLVNHQGRSQARTDLVRLKIEGGSVEVVRRDVQAVSGDLEADGRSYILARADGHRTSFHRLDLEGGDDEELFTLPPGAYVGWVRTSPGGGYLAVTLMEDDRWSVAILDASEGGLVGKWSTGVSHWPAFDPYWISEDRLLFVAPEEDGRIQVFGADLTDSSVRRLSEVPYMAYNPRPDGRGGLVMLNRSDWGWSLDHVALPGGEPTEAVAFVDGRSSAIEGYKRASRNVEVVDDRPYSPTDGLFAPRLRVPALAVLWDNGGIEEIHLSLGLSGRDELGIHNWAVDSHWDFAEERLSGSAAYVNTALAPWMVTAQVANRWLTGFSTLGETSNLTATRAQRDRFGRLQLSRYVYDMPLWLEMRAADFFREAAHDEEADTRRLLGPEVGGAYRAGRSTTYGGAQSMFALSAHAGAYPSELGSDLSMGDLRTQLEIHSPLPLSSRHRLRLSGRARWLPGVDDDDALMRVGGFSEVEPIAVSGDAEPQALGSGILPRGFLFVEPLRGYEDLGLATNRVAIADLNYRYPIIVDRGRATSLSVFPSLFFRGLNLEGFASGATMMDGDLHAALGMSVDAQAILWRAPFQIRYQLAQRLFDDEKLVHIIGAVVGGGF